MNSSNPAGSRPIRTIAAMVSIFMLVALLAACGGIGGKETEETRVIRIATLYGDKSQGDYLRTEYTDLYEFTHDHIDIEFVYAVDYSTRRYNNRTGEDMEKEPDPVEEMKKLMEGDNPPDIVMLDYGMLSEFINDNLLMPLDPYIAEDEFDTSGYVPAVIDGLKAVGNNTLYALAPTFSSSALVYNKAIFDEMGVAHPTDNMTWEEMFALAEQVANGEEQNRKYGFSFRTYSYSNMMDDFQVYTAPLELQMMDEAGENMLVDSQPWRDVMNRLVELYKADVMPDQEDYYRGRENNPDYKPGPFENDAFLSGKVAMSILPYYQVSDLVSANQNAQNIEGFDGIQWDVVTIPVHPEYPNVGGFVEMNPIMAINAKATNPDDAWDLIRFNNSKEWAELKSRSSNRLLSRSEFIKPIDGLDYNVEAFTKLIPAKNPMNSNYGPSNELYWSLQNIGRNKFDQVIRGDMEVERALQEWQTEGNALLKAIKENPDTPIWELQNQIQMESRQQASDSSSGSVKVMK